jgi:hypothetical protein
MPLPDRARITLEPAPLHLYQECVELLSRIDALRQELDDKRALLAAHCPVRPGETMPADQRREAMLVDRVEAETDEAGVVWTLRGRHLTKAGAPHKTATTHRYVFGLVDQV